MRKALISAVYGLPHLEKLWFCSRGPAEPEVDVRLFTDVVEALGKACPGLKLFDWFLYEAPGMRCWRHRRKSGKDKWVCSIDQDGSFKQSKFFPQNLGRSGK